MQLQYFNIKEFDCQETGNNEMCPFFLEKLDELRHVCGFSFTITSGYRDPSHSIEAKKIFQALMPGELLLTYASTVVLRDIR